jgi:hypothetical protein
MLLERADCREGTDTIVFRKPGFWGIWHDVGQFPRAVLADIRRDWGDYTWVID